MTTRALDALHLAVRDRGHEVREMFDRETPAGVLLLIYCTWRSEEDQAILFRQGRTLAQIEAKAQSLANRGYPQLAQILMDAPPQYASRRVTYAGPGESFHQHRVAWDAVPMVSGKPVWSTRSPRDQGLWSEYGRCCRTFGMEWAGDWRRFREFPHAQFTMGLELELWMARTYPQGKLVA